MLRNLPLRVFQGQQHDQQDSGLEGVQMRGRNRARLEQQLAAALVAVDRQDRPGVRAGTDHHRFVGRGDHRR